MEKRSLTHHLKTQYLGKELYYFEHLASTNATAKELATSTKKHNSFTVVAQEQSQGRGTDDHLWHSPQGNLYLSVVFPFDQQIDTLFPLYPAVALAKVLREKYHIAAHVKWPNDVLVGHKKIAGILCEGVTNRFMIMGIGINVQQTDFPEVLSSIATSIVLENKQNPSLESVFQSFLQEYEKLFYGNCDIRQEWIKHTLMLGKTIQSTQEGISKSVIVSDLSPEGFLEVVDTNGKKETWMARRGLDISANY